MADRRRRWAARCDSRSPAAAGTRRAATRGSCASVARAELLAHLAKLVAEARGVRRAGEARQIPLPLRRALVQASDANEHGAPIEEHTSELQSPYDLVCRLLLEKKKKPSHNTTAQPYTTH